LIRKMSNQIFSSNPKFLLKNSISLGHMSPGHMMPDQMSSLWLSPVIYDPRNILLKFGQNLVSKS